jgi:hypothetical protein
MKAILLKNITRDTWNIHLKKGDEVEVEVLGEDNYRIHIRGPLYVGILRDSFEIKEEENEPA